MKIKLIIVCLSISLVDCGLYSKMAHIELDTKPISENKATVIFYTDEKFLPTFEIFTKANNKKLGELTSVKPLKIEIDSGEQELYADMPDGMAIRRVFTTKLTKGKTYILRVYAKIGYWVSSFMIEEVRDVNSYDTNVGWKG